MTDHHYIPEEIELRTQTLSPVSPKPVHFPQPSSIPILENQMDSNMTEASTYRGTAFQRQDPEDATTAGSSQEAAGGAAQAQTQTGAPEGSGMQEIPHHEAQGQEVVNEPATLDSMTAVPSNQAQSEHITADGGAQTIGQDVQGYNVHDPIANGSLEGESIVQGKQTLEEAEATQRTADDQQQADIQALLDTIISQNAASSTKSPASAENEPAPQSASNSFATQAAAQAAVPANLPPRPPTKQSYAGPPGVETPTLSNLPPPVTSVGAPGTSPATNNLPPPPGLPSVSAGDHNGPTTPNGRQTATNELSEDDYIEPRWSPEIQRKYDEFLEQERIYVMKGEWEKFPASSRLFIGNLPTEKVTKRDLFHVFHKYGPLAQVSIKQAYGFVQFLSSQDCVRAIEAEQAVSIRGRKLHLEVSKPQRNKNQNGRESRQRRSRSPDRYRGGGDNRRQRSISPRSRARGGRRRSRSRSPLGRNRVAPHDLDDDCPLPRRAPQNVPDIQIIAKDDPDRTFVSYVERAFEARGARANVLLLSPKIPEASVMRRQIIEGVLAVMKLDRSTQMRNQFELSVFDRSQGANNVRFEEYAQLDLNICVELVLRAKQTAKSPMPQFGGGNSYGLPMAPPQIQQTLTYTPQQPQRQPPQQFYGQQQPSLPQTPQPSYGGYDPNSIQGLLNRVQQGPSQQQAPTVYGGTPQPNQGHNSDLSRLLASVSGGGPAAQNAYGVLQQHQQQGNLPPNIATLLGNLNQQRPPQPSTPSYGQQYQPQPPPQQQYQPQQHQQHQQQQPPADMSSIMGLRHPSSLPSSVEIRTHLANVLVPDPDAPPTDVRFKAWLANVFCTGKAWPGIEVCRTEQQREPERQERDWVYRANTGRALPPKKCKETKKVSVVHGGASPDMTAWLPVKCETKQEWTIKEDIEKLFSEWDGTMEMREETEGHAPFNEDIKCSSPYIKTETKEEYD